ncbi:molecular chaperone [Enterobacter sp. CP102]|uniref:fimbrial biogenesis chaperone n=1 Tax=Enterobacter sp. CP102 TaxID=2976431 RepID=UPI002200F838|nr:fimbria/pilus periplasmic chaperone [Enterobacter sp. CP102]UWM64716.1 fimbria/pilus periplasmic chaperone [Enterobacter sp. CP102]
MKKLILLFSAMVISFAGNASVVINATRIIYPAQSKYVNIQLVNRSKTTHLVQSWIDTGNPGAAPETIKTPFSLTPPVVKMAANDGQALKLSLINGEQLPKDRESVYWLNVLDVPPVPEASKDGDNYLQVALRSRIKLLYRPENLSELSNETIKKVSLSQQSGATCLKNDSPYYITITEIVSWHGGDIKKKTTEKNLLTNAAFISPFSCMQIAGSIKQAGSYRAAWIDDYGSKRYALIS